MGQARLAHVGGHAEGGRVGEHEAGEVAQRADDGHGEGVASVASSKWGATATKSRSTNHTSTSGTMVSTPLSAASAEPT